MILYFPGILSSAAGTSVAWLWCWWSSFQELQYWWRSHSIGWWVWCTGSANRTFPEAVGDDDEWPKSASKTMALYTQIFVPFFMWLLHHIRLYSLPSALQAYCHFPCWTQHLTWWYISSRRTYEPPSAQSRQWHYETGGTLFLVQAFEVLSLL